MISAIKKSFGTVIAFTLAFQILFADYSYSQNASSYQSAISQIAEVLRTAPQAYYANIRAGGANAPTPELGKTVEELYSKIIRDESIQSKVRQDRAFRALYIQTITHLKHVRMSFEMGSTSYTHDFVLRGPYPYRPTLIALQKTMEFLEIAESTDTQVIESQKNPEREKQLMDEQKALVKKITSDSYQTYHEMRERLVRGGVNASFHELGAVVEYLHLKLSSDNVILESSRSNQYLASFRSIALRQLEAVSKPSPNGSVFPYMKTIDAIERATEFLDVMQRNNDPSRSPKLYHSGRYEYYIHYLKAQAPDHISLPTLVSLGATDILKSRGVPIGFWGVNTEVAWVDGYYQTSYEFLIHDVNHTRRMYQFLHEEAVRLGISVDEFARRSDEFVKNKLIPLISVKKTDDEVTKNKKRLLKVLLFEILHEDALPASKEVIETAVLRPPNKLTPFEKIENGTKVLYVMEPGATTLAYVFRKLAHDFYDMPGDRQDNIVGQEFRTRANIVEAAETLFKELGLDVKRELFVRFTYTDEGFPKDFKGTLVRDIEARPNETVPLSDATNPRSGAALKCSELFLSR